MTKKKEILTDRKAMELNAVLPAVVFAPQDKLPERDGEDSESIEVGVIIEGEHFEGFYDHDGEEWWVNLGGITVGHRQMEGDEIEGWYYLGQK